MINNLILAIALTFAASNFAAAGDTVTITSPGGATQTISSSVISAAINSASRSGAILTVGGASSVIVSITQSTPGGNTIVTTVGGSTYNVSSGFIGRLLAFYG